MNPKQRFILDENVIICAQTGYNDRQELDVTCSILVNEIIRICHTLVLDTNLWGRYQRQLHRLRNQPTAIGSNLPSILDGAIRITGKYDSFERGAAPPFAGEELIPTGSQDDIAVTVRLAVATGAVLVTADQPLRQDLLSSGIQDKYGLVIMDPEEALSQMSE